MAEDISVPNLKITVEEFNARLIKLSKIKPHEAFKYLDEAIIYFNHHVVDGKIVQISNTNCVNVVEALETFFKTGKIITVESSGFQNILKLEKLYKKPFLSLSIPSIEKVMKEGERGIIYGIRRFPEEGHVFNIVKKGELIFIDAQTISGKANLRAGYESFKYLKTH